MQIKASISILLFSFGADPLYRRSPRLSRPPRFRRPRWPFSFDLIKVEHSIVCFESVVPSSIRASRHDHDKLGHRHRMVAFSSLRLKTPSLHSSAIEQCASQCPTNDRRGVEMVWYALHVSDEGIIVGHPTWPQPSGCGGGHFFWSAAPPARWAPFRGAPSPYALPVNARPMGRPQLAVTKSQHRSFGMPPWSYRPLPRLAHLPAE
jgi:hypothetical protein